MAERITAAKPVVTAKVVAPTTVRVGQAVKPATLAAIRNVPGARLAQQAQESPATSFSIGRALLLAGLGAAAGGLVAKLTKHKMLPGAGIGAASGAAASVLADVVGAGDQDKLEEAIVVAPPDSAGKGGMTVAVIKGGASKTRAALRDQTKRTITMAEPKAVLLTEVDLDEPPGWLAAVIAHGGAIQSGIMDYIRNHRDTTDHTAHLFPHMKVTAPKTKHGSWTRHWDGDKIFTNRFMEWPSPCFPHFRPPMVTYDIPNYQYGKYSPDVLEVEVSGSKINSTRLSSLTGYSALGDHPPVWGDAEVNVGCPSWAATYRAYQEYSNIFSHIGCPDDQKLEDKDEIVERTVEFLKTGRLPRSLRPARNIYAWIKNFQDTRRFQGKKLDRRQYEDARDRYFARQGLDKSKYMEPVPTSPGWSSSGSAQPQSPPVQMGPPGQPMMATFTAGKMRFKYPVIDKITSSYWNKNATYRATWFRRLNQYYVNGNWLVWAAEMIRLHSKGWKDAPDIEWQDHCTLWGVGTPDSTQRSNRRNMAEYYSDGRYKLDYSKSQVREILRAVMRHTPPPIDPRFLGNQIVPEGARRTLLDIPAAAGSLQIPAYADWWCPSIGTYAGGSAGSFNAYETIVQVATSLCSQGVGNAVVGTIGSTIIATTISETIQNIYRMAARGEWFSGTADVVALVGEFARSVGTYLAGDTAAEVLSNLQAQGIDFDMGQISQEALQAPGVKGLLSQIQSQYTTLRDAYNWPYLDQAFSGLLSDAETKTRYGIGK